MCFQLGNNAATIDQAKDDGMSIKQHLGYQKRQQQASAIFFISDERDVSGQEPHKRGRQKRDPE